MGDVGHVYIKLRKGSCRIDWGDGKSTPLFTYKEDWLSANHTYPPGCKISKEQFEITITSLEDNIIGFRADSGEMMVTDVDIRECQSLKYLRATLKRNRDYNDDKDGQLRIEFEI
jgi:hypothetical protein